MVFFTNKPDSTNIDTRSTQIKVVVEMSIDSDQCWDYNDPLEVSELSKTASQSKSSTLWQAGLVVRDANLVVSICVLERPQDHWSEGHPVSQGP